MMTIFPDLLRSVISDVMILILLFSLAHPKKKKMVLIFLVVYVIIESLLESRFYLQGDYNTIVWINLFFSAPAMFFSKIFFREKFVQWCFNVLTAMNFFIMSVFLSYPCVMLGKTGLSPRREYQKHTNKSTNGLCGFCQILMDGKRKQFPVNYVKLKINCTCLD